MGTRWAPRSSAFRCVILARGFRRPVPGAGGPAALPPLCLDLVPVRGRLAEQLPDLDAVDRRRVAHVVVHLDVDAARAALEAADAADDFRQLRGPVEVSVLLGDARGLAAKLAQEALGV